MPTHTPQIDEALSRYARALAQAVLAALEDRDNPSKDFREALQARWEDVRQAAKTA